MTTTSAKSRKQQRQQKQQNVTRFIKNTFLFSMLLLSLSGQSFAISTSISNADFYNYAGKVKFSIQRELHISSAFHGQVCELKLKFSPNGLLVSATPSNRSRNDIAFCNAVIKAAELARMPDLPSVEMYNLLDKEGLTIVFKS